MVNIVFGNFIEVKLLWALRKNLGYPSAKMQQKCVTSPIQIFHWSLMWSFEMIGRDCFDIFDLAYLVPLSWSKAHVWQQFHKKNVIHEIYYNKLIQRSYKRLIAFTVYSIDFIDQSRVNNSFCLFVKIAKYLLNLINKNGAQYNVRFAKSRKRLNRFGQFRNICANPEIVQNVRNNFKTA